MLFGADREFVDKTLARALQNDNILPVVRVFRRASEQAEAFAASGHGDGFAETELGQAIKDGHKPGHFIGVVSAFGRIDVNVTRR